MSQSPFPEEQGSLVAIDEPVDLSDLRWSDGIVLVLFWVLAFIVFLQFWTRYVLNDSYGWTEEIARYFLIAVTFVGGIMAVRKKTQIAVEVFYRWMSRPVRRVFSTFVDVVSAVFFGYMTVLSVKLSQRTGQMMVSVDIPKSYLYWIVAVAFAFMTLYALRNLVEHWRTGTSPLIEGEDRSAETRLME